MAARIDPANLDLLNDRLTELRQKKERLELERAALRETAPKQSAEELATSKRPCRIFMQDKRA